MDHHSKTYIDVPPHLLNFQPRDDEGETDKSPPTSSPASASSQESFFSACSNLSVLKKPKPSDICVADLLSEPLPIFAVPRSSHAWRPETEVFARLNNRTPNANWARAIKRLQEDVFPHVADTLGLHWVNGDDEGRKPVWILLQVLGILLYELECAGANLPRLELVTTPHSPSTLQSDRFARFNLTDVQAILKSISKRDMKLMLEYILCIDYGIEPPSLNSVSGASKKAFAALSKQLFATMEEVKRGGHELSLNDFIASQKLTEAVYILARDIGLNVTDVALMMYHFARTTGPAITFDDTNHWGFGYYSPYVDELRREVQSRGPDRILRKLSVDINDIIPTVAFDYDRRGALERAVRLIALSHGLENLSMEAAYPGPCHPRSLRRPSMNTRLQVRGLTDEITMAMHNTFDGLVGLVISGIAYTGGSLPEPAPSKQLSEEEEPWELVDSDLGEHDDDDDEDEDSDWDII